jgi:hypothetical protein
MLVFVDESGDVGMNFTTGSTSLFTVAMIVFEEHDEAENCGDRIDLLRQELGLAADFEFHFKSNSDRIRFAFLRAISSYNFWVYCFVIDKTQLNDSAIQNPSAFYKYACGLVFESAKPILDEASIHIDESGNNTFKLELASYLKKKLNDSGTSQKRIRRVTMQDSSRNNLVQLADMVCCAIGRAYKKDKKNADCFRKIIKHREISVQFWPQ